MKNHHHVLLGIVLVAVAVLTAGAAAQNDLPEAPRAAAPTEELNPSSGDAPLAAEVSTPESAETTGTESSQRRASFGGAFCECTGSYTTATYDGAASTCNAAWQEVVSQATAEANAYCYSLGHDYSCRTFPGDHSECEWNGSEYLQWGFAEYGCGSFC